MSRPESSVCQRPKQPGRYCPLTAPEIARVRAVFSDLTQARRLRQTICHDLNITIEKFNEIGLGISGKKPRPEL